MMRLRDLAVVRMCAFAVLVMGTAALRADTVVNWTTQAGPSDFDNTAITFAGISASALKFDGNGIYHNHGNASVVFTIDLSFNGGPFTTIHSFTAPATSDVLMSSLGTIAFTSPTVSSLVTGLRLTDTPTVFNGYHVFTNETITFSGAATTDATAAPLPGAALAGMGLFSLLGGKRFVTRRRDRVAA